MRSLKIATAIMVLVVLAGYYYFNYYTNQNNALDDFAYGNGRIEATEVNVATKISGRVEKVLVKEGDIVEKGQAIALLDTKELEAKLAMANAQINQAKENKNYALSLVIQKQSELSLATKEYERAKKLYASKSISLAAFQKDETTYHTAKAVLASAKANVQALEASIQAAIAQAQAIEVNIQESTLYAPLKGRVLYKLVQAGEVISSGKSVVILLDLLDVYMTIFLPTAQAGVVQYGSEARMILDAYPHITIPASVTFISPQSQFTPKQIETQSEREKLMFKVKATIDFELLQEYIEKVRIGLPGVTYIQLNKEKEWPPMLTHLPQYYDKKK